MIRIEWLIILFLVLTVKVDPYPYLKNGTFDIETIKTVIANIGRIKGVVKFRVDNPQMINIGV